MPLHPCTHTHAHAHTHSDAHTRTHSLTVGLASLTEQYADTPNAPTGDDVVVPASKLLVAAQFDGVW